MLDVFNIGGSAGLSQGPPLASVAASGENSPQMTDGTTTNSPPPIAAAEPGQEPPSLRLAGTSAGPVTEEEAGLLGLRASLVRTLAANQQDATEIRDRLERAGRRDAIREVTGHDAFDRSTRVAMDLLNRVDARLEEIDVQRKAARIEVDADAEALIRRP
jgi:hypothetical protein